MKIHDGLIVKGNTVRAPGGLTNMRHQFTDNISPTVIKIDEHESYSPLRSDGRIIFRQLNGLENVVHFKVYENSGTITFRAIPHFCVKDIMEVCGENDDKV